MASALNIGFWPCTDVGRVRDANEDSFLVDPDLSLVIVADGMGGHAAGEVASHIAVRVFRDTLKRERARIDRFEHGVDPKERVALVQLMETAVQNACAAVFAEAQRDPAKRGMGTTLVALLFAGTRGFIAHVGDSRIYLRRAGAVYQLTQDHSLVNELMRRGRLKPEEIAGLRVKNAVTRAVGVHESVQPDTLDFDVLAGDCFLLCSDGLSDYAEEPDILRIFGEHPIEAAAQAFVDHANRGGGKDNITAVVARVPDAAAGLDRLAAEVNLKIETLHAMPIFHHLSYQELVRVLNIVDVRMYRPGERILTQGELGDEMFIVLSGRVSVRAGTEELVGLGPGQHFGEMALIDRAPRSASVVSETDAKLMVVHRRDFFDIVRNDHDVAVKLLWSFLGVLSDRLRRTSRDLGDARKELAQLGGGDRVSETDIQEL
jgi:serine/threonine protein phosphatase PrpC